MHPPETAEAGASVDSVLQVHPTRVCNLTCRHCYSVSGPAQRTHLDVDLLADVLRDAGGLGYTRVSFSGGEPLMYRPLRQLLELARELGLTTSVTTNGTLITAENARWLGELVDVLAVSVDGEPESHNRIRGSVHAYEWTERGLQRLGDAGVPFATIFTLTETNVDELPWVADLTARYGGRAVQIHPLESAGRATVDMPGDVPTSGELAQAFFNAVGLVPQLLAGASNGSNDPAAPRASAAVRLHADVADTRVLARHPDAVLGPEAVSPATLVASLARPLVLEDDGAVVPVTYGFPRRFAFGNITQAPLRDLAGRWIEHTYPEFREVVVEALTRLRDRPPDFPFVNWYEFLNKAAASHARHRVDVG
jgi:pyruvate-formate lyase-activating enzyme